MSDESGGPLHGIRVVELAGLGPAPFCGMMLADMGADVVRVIRPGPAAPNVATDIINRHRRTVVLDLKSADDLAGLLELVDAADVLLEGFRPGVTERLGIGPDVCLGRNPGLVYGRMTGWGQDGPLASTAGHDINYIARTGALHAIGRAGGPPGVPLNLLGDFGGGGMMLAFGVLVALIERQRSGRGQVVDAAIVDGVVALMAMQWGFLASGFWQDQRGVNTLDTGAPFYDVYETSDGQWMSVGAIEPQFYAELLKLLDLVDLPSRDDRNNWPRIREAIAAVFRNETRDHWSTLFEGTDACVAPVLSMTEATRDAHMSARETFVESGGLVQHRPAPRFSRTPPRMPTPLPTPVAKLDEVMSDWRGRESQRDRGHETADTMEA